MRKKCYDYLAKPSAELREELTTMEQQWVDKIQDGELPKPKPPKDPIPATLPPTQPKSKAK